jgi:hypothetical protein
VFDQLETFSAGVVTYLVVRHGRSVTSDLRPSSVGTRLVREKSAEGPQTANASKRKPTVNVQVSGRVRRDTAGNNTVLHVLHELDGHGRRLVRAGDA